MIRPTSVKEKEGKKVYKYTGDFVKFRGDIDVEFYRKKISEWMYNKYKTKDFIEEEKWDDNGNYVFFINTKNSSSGLDTEILNSIEKSITRNGELKVYQKETEEFDHTKDLFVVKYKIWIEVIEGKAKKTKSSPRASVFDRMGLPHRDCYLFVLSILGIIIICYMLYLHWKDYDNPWQKMAEILTKFEYLSIQYLWNPLAHWSDLLSKRLQELLQQ
jgi:hypothetical protein